MKLYQQRVYQEHEEIVRRHNKLIIFTQSQKFDKLPRAEQGRMLHQAEIMGQYANILNERIAAFQSD